MAVTLGCSPSFCLCTPPRPSKALAARMPTQLSPSASGAVSHVQCVHRISYCQCILKPASGGAIRQPHAAGRNTPPHDIRTPECHAELRRRAKTGARVWRVQEVKVQRAAGWGGTERRAGLPSISTVPHQALLGVASVRNPKKRKTRTLGHDTSPPLSAPRRSERVVLK